MNWRKFDDEKPEDGQICLTKMKHGIISGFYNPKESNFSGYYWQEMEWYASHWIPIEEVED
jgi:hypothetical protein